MTIDMEFSIPFERTIREMNDLLNELSLNDRLTVGGDDGDIQYTKEGDVFILETEDEDVPKMLRIIHEHGLWPSVTAVYGNTPSMLDLPNKKEADRFLAENNDDFDALWCSVIKKAMEEDDYD